MSRCNRAEIVGGVPIDAVDTIVRGSGVSPKVLRSDRWKTRLCRHSVERLAGRKLEVEGVATYHNPR